MLNRGGAKTSRGHRLHQAVTSSAMAFRLRWRAAAAARLLRVPHQHGLRGHGRQAVLMRDAGATIIGGCCGSTPAHLKAIAELVTA